MMKKITLLLGILSLFNFSQAQLFWYDDITDQPTIDAYTIIDSDGRAINSFYTDQGVFGNGSWEVVNFGEGAAHFSCSNFSGADSCLATSDWLMLPELDFTGASAPFLEFDGYSSVTGLVNVYVTASIAGTTPVVSDFTGAPVGTLTTSGSWISSPTIDLTSFGNDASVYIAIVNVTASCNADIVGVRNILVKNLTAVDVAVENLNLVTNDLSNENLAFNYSILGCDVPSSPVTFDIFNEGTAPLNDTLFLAYVYQDASATNIQLEDTILSFIASPLAVGATYTHTFSVPADFSNVEVTVFNVIAFVNNEGDGLTNNDIVHILINSAPVDLSVVDYTTSFELDFDNEPILANTLGWVFENNSAGFTEYAIQDFSVFTDGSNFIYEGTNVLVNDYTGTGASFPAVNNWAFSPCVEFETGGAYELSFYFNALVGDIAPHRIDFALCSDQSSSSVVFTPLTNVVFNDTVLTKYSGSFTVPTGGTYHLGIHDESPAPGYIMTIDSLVITKLTTPVVNISLSASSIDAPGVEYCDSTVTVNFSATESPSTLSLNWGDGNVENVTGSTSATHSYADYGSYSISLTATNIVGSGNNSTSLNVTAIPAPTVTFGPPAVAGQTVTISIGTAIGSNIVYAPSCSRVIIDWGDGTIDEVTGQTSASHTYATFATFTITASVLGTPAATATQSVVITGINDINFVEALNIFPNPSNDFVSLSFGLESADNLEISIYAIDGKVMEVRSFENTQNVKTTFNTTSLNNGIYVMKIKTSNGFATQKFVVNHN